MAKSKVLKIHLPEIIWKIIVADAAYRDIPLSQLGREVLEWKIGGGHIPVPKNLRKEYDEYIGIGT